MKILETAGKKVAGTAARVVGAVARAVAPSAEDDEQPTDPWYYNEEHRREVAGRGRWLGQRRPFWLRR